MTSRGGAPRAWKNRQGIYGECTHPAELLRTPVANAGAESGRPLTPES